MFRRQSIRICWAIVVLGACGSQPLVEGGSAANGGPGITAGAGSTPPAGPSTSLSAGVTDSVLMSTVPMTGLEEAVGAGLPLIDDKIKVTDTPTIADYFTYSTVEELLASSEVVVVGRLVDAVADIRRIEPMPGDPGQHSASFDGLIFEIDEVFRGPLAVGQRATVAEVSTSSTNGKKERAHPSRVKILDSGLRDKKGKHSYLMFLVQRPGWEPVLEFNGPGGIAELNNKGKIVKSLPEGVLSQFPDALEQLRQMPRS